MTHVDRHPDLKQQCQLLESIPGIGKRTATSGDEAVNALASDIHWNVMLETPHSSPKTNRLMHGRS